MRIGYVCASGETFLKPILDHWRAKGHEVVLVDDWPMDPMPDVFWVEWADANLVKLTHVIQRVPAICRLHSFEAFSPHLRQVVWSNLDDLVLVAPHVRDYLLRAFPDLFGPAAVEGKPPPDPPEIHVIPNGIDLARWPARTTPVARFGQGRNIAWVGGISHKKGPELFGQAALYLLERDPSASLHIAGQWQEARYTPYLEHLFGESIAQRIQFHGAIPADAMPDFYRGMDVVLSTSPWESFQYAVAEGILSGCLPLVHDWPGARETYPHARVWRTLDELDAAYRRPWSEWEAARARKDIEERYALPVTLERIDRLLEERVAKGMRHPAPTVSVAMLVAGDEPRFRAAVESVRGYVTEVVAHIDTRRSEANVRVAEELGVKYTAGPPPTFAGAIDFAAARNMVADRCTGEWIFILDSDELVEDPASIGPMLADVERRGKAIGRPYDAIAMTVDCYVDAGLSESSRDVRFHRRLPTTRWRYPVHNQLLGYQCIYGIGGGELKIRSTYVGGLKQRGHRSIPPLLELWRLANEEPLDGVLVVNGIEIPKGATRKHAAFFLARMQKVAGNEAEAMSWYETCRQVCPDLRYASPFWPWYAEATLRTSGVTAAEAVVDEGLRHWPSHPDLHHFRIGLNMIRFARAAMDETSMSGVPMASRGCLEGIEAAGKALKLPIQMWLQRGGQGA